jgi:hypothetical protein
LEFQLLLFRRGEIWIGDQEPELAAPIRRVRGFPETFDRSCRLKLAW